MFNKFFLQLRGGRLSKHNRLSFPLLTLRALHMQGVARLLIPRLMPALPEVFDAEAYLQSVSPDPDSSAICTNEITPQCDLQIIVPVYNVERYICDCMDSIVNQQSRFTFHVTVVNDGSPDKSRELLCRYEGLPCVTIIDQKNRGLSGARNAALNHIIGRYVMFVDSDDCLASGAIDSLMSKAETSGADIVEGSWQNIDEDGLIFNTHKYKEEEHLQCLSGFPWGKVIRAELLRNIQFPEGYWFEDTLLYLVLFDMAMNMARIPQIVYNYRINSAGITSSAVGRPKCLDSFYVTRRLMKDRDKLNIPLTTFAYEKFLRQVRTNFGRTINLTPIEKVTYAQFIATCSLHSKHCADAHTDNPELQMLSEALRHRDYRLYLCSMV